MKKALLAALCAIIVGLTLVGGTFALPDLNKVFADLRNTFGEALGLPEIGGAGTKVHVALVADDTQQNLYPGGEVSRSFKVENKGTGDVYFRLVYAVQYEEDSWDKLDIDFIADSKFTEHAWQSITVGSENIPYRMKVFTYTEALPVNAVSPEIIISIGMDVSVTSEQITSYRSDFLKTQVLAIEPAPFTQAGITDASQALDKALPLGTLNPF